MLLDAPPTKARTSGNEVCQNNQLLKRSSTASRRNLHVFVISGVKPSSGVVWPGTPGRSRCSWVFVKRSSLRNVKYQIRNTKRAYLHQQHITRGAAPALLILGMCCLTCLAVSACLLLLFFCSLIWGGERESFNS